MVIALAAAGLAVLVVVRGSDEAPGPEGRADGLFPAATSGLPFSVGRLERTRAWAGTTQQRSYSVRIPDGGDGAYLLVRCDHGRISVDFGGGIVARECSGRADPVSGNVRGPDWGGKVTVSVDQKQVGDWGLATYRRG